MEVMEKLMTSNVAYLAVAAAAVLAGIIFLVFRMNPGPNFEEVFRKQREQLQAMDEPKQKKKEKTSKKKEKRADKKEPQHPAAVSTTSSLPTNAGGTADDSVKQQDHVDFSEKQQIKVVELDEVPQVETGKVLAPSRQPVKPILVHTEEANKNPITVTEPLKIVRSNSFREIKPKDEVELHHKKQQQSPSKSSQSTAPTAKVAPISVSHQPQRLTQQIEEAKEVSQILSQKRQVTKSEASETGSSKKNSPVHEKKERKVFSKKELRELINQIEQRELPADMGEETVQRLVDALLNHQNESKEWKSTRQDPMQTLRKKLAEKEEIIVQLNGRLESALARSKELHNETSVLKTKCSQLQNSVGQIENRFREDLLKARNSQVLVESQMKHVEAFNETLHGRVQELDAKNKELENSLRKADERVHDAKRFAEDVEKLNQRICTLEHQLQEATSIREKLEAEKRKTEAKLQMTEHELALLKSVSEEAQLQIASLKKDLSGAQNVSKDASHLTEENASLKEELDQLKTRNNQLHQKNWTTVEGLNQAEKKFSDLQRKVLEDEEKSRKLLIQAFPKEAANDLKDLEGEEFVKSVVQQLKLQSKETEKLKAEISSLKTSLSEVREALAAAEAAAASVTTASVATTTEASAPAKLAEANDKLNHGDDGTKEELERLREEVLKLRKDSAHYSAVLNDTEKLLKNLQDGVEREEQKWNEDRKRFEAEKAEMSVAFRDLQSELIELRTQLQDSEQERSSTINELGDTKATVDKLSQQLAEAQRSATPVEPQRNGHQSEESAATSPTPNAQQNGGNHDGDEGDGDGGERATANKKNKKKKKAKKVS